VKSRKPGDILMPFRVVLHGAAAKRIKSGVYAVISPADRGKITYQFGFTYLGEHQFLAQKIPGRQLGRGYIQFRKSASHLTRFADIRQ